MHPSEGFHLDMSIREIIVPQAEETQTGVLAEFKKDTVTNHGGEAI